MLKHLSQRYLTSMYILAKSSKTFKYSLEKLQKSGLTERRKAEIRNKKSI